MKRKDVDLLLGKADRILDLGETQFWYYSWKTVSVEEKKETDELTVFSIRPKLRKVELEFTHDILTRVKFPK
ncbi:MAG: hypothetical protein HRT89_12095 [Lentisphaeria bacterium]|nr:hypothetical protein [Lentisphaeria bacterium]